MAQDFTKPNGRALQELDSAIQNMPLLEKRWDRHIQDYFRCEGSGYGWEGIEKADPKGFKKAWFAAMSFAVDCEIDLTKI
jgi:hypothetical protein